MAHPWIERLPSANTLTEPLRIWTFLAGNTAKGDLDAVERDWQHLSKEAHAGGIEIILQTHLFAGYPRTINALATVRSEGVAESHVGEGDPAGWPSSGEQNCRTIYGGSYDKLRARIAELHPDLDSWMVEIGYGRILSRPGPTLRERELCVLAVLAGQDVRPQLISHLRGARRAGAAWEECCAVLAQTELVWGGTAAEQTEAIRAELDAELR